MNLIEQLKRHEGFESDYYQCTANKTTIGYGRNVEDNPFTAEELVMLGREEFFLEAMTEEEAEFLLENDVNNIKTRLMSLFPLENLNGPREAVCINMAFNLGIGGFFKFKKMISAVKDGYYEKAAVEMMDSRWAKQVSNRANELAIQMHSGSWQ